MNLERETMLAAITSAGDAVLDYQKKQVVTATQKPNCGPVTEADLLANAILREHLMGLFPEDGWLSEETVDDKRRLDRERVWIVDPIDGTKEFIQNVPEYALSVALVEHRAPILAAVYNPARKELFHAIKGQGAWLNGRPIHHVLSLARPLHVLVSRSEFSDGKWAFLTKGPIVAKPTGSIAYKLSLIAQGAAHAALSVTPKHEWDIAAGVLIAQEAGAFVTDIFKRPFVFNQERPIVPGVLAAAPQAMALLGPLVDESLRHLGQYGCSMRAFTSDCAHQ